MIEDWVRTGSLILGILGVVWILLKDKIVNDLAPKMSLYFQTRDEAAKFAETHRSDHRTLEAQIGSIAEHKADQAVKPLAGQLAQLERDVNSLQSRLDKSHDETREDFLRVFVRLDSIMNEIRNPSSGA